MNKKCLAAVIALILVLSASGCRSIYVGGSGSVGDVSGGGGVNIPIPKGN
jgi:hypothetical protein